ncbi:MULTISPECIES: RsiV family protein [Pseudomonas]|uniref:RsiV family protein n=1 Tax=Pseudomonas TaxID=286 RepID=UPI0004747CAF|nr:MULTISPECIES: RsiV family protein [Pseudomonas]
MRLSKLLVIASAAVLLSACQSFFKPDLNEPLKPKRVAWEHRPAGCANADCPFVNVDTLKFDDEHLNAIIEQALLEETRPEPGAPVAQSLDAYEQDFLRNAQPRWSSYLQANIREQHDGLVIVELSSYLDTGGAHGQPGRSIINYDRQQKKVLTLQDILVPGQEQAFWDVAKTAHQAWLIANGLKDDGAFEKEWPFVKTSNIALDFGAVTLKYDVTSIAPYSMGHPLIKIPYPKLNGIVRPEYFPGRRAL